MRSKRLLCDGWEFAKCALGTDYEEAAGFKQVDIPHDWMIYDTLNLYEDSTGWYRRSLNYVNDGDHIILRFEGIYMDSRVYVNGKLVKEWKYGYTTFETDITEVLKEGENLITVRVDYHSPNTRWYSGAGIYRPVYMIKVNPVHITYGGVYVTASEDGKVIVTTETERPDSMSVAELKVRNSIYDGDNLLAQTIRDCCALDISQVNKLVKREGCLYSENTDTLYVDKPELWDLDNTKLYRLVTEIIRGEAVVDTVVTSFGFRTIEFTTDKGFFLNHKNVKLHGVCEHHDLGALGAAFNKAAMRRKIEILKTMGVNAVRTSHNPPAVEWMELFDEMGILCVSEAFDMWEMQKTEYDYGRFFAEWSEIDVASWVRRDRNHPSIIAWSIGNEIYDTHASDHGQEITSRLLRHVREHDSRHQGYVTQGSNFMQWTNAQKCADILKIAGYNYAERLYDDQHAEHPDWCIYGSETSSVTQSRGIYHFPLSERILTEDDEQCSALGNTSPGWASKNDEANIIPDRDREYCAGQFIWTGFDYIGEPTPYSTKNSYFGKFDTAGFAKDGAFIYKSAWTDSAKAPFVHIFPYWDFIAGQDIDVRVATNCPHIKLFRDGEEILSKDIDVYYGTELTADTILKYAPGELKAIAYDASGNAVAEDTVTSFTDAVKVRLQADRPSVKADGQDMVFITIDVLDEAGRAVENANNRVKVEVTGAGRLVGLDNGDSTDYDAYKGVSRRLFSGKLLAMIAAKTQPGDIEIKVTSKGLETAVLTIPALAAELTEGVSAMTENLPGYIECADPDNDVPVRKIELLSPADHFDPDHRELTVKVLAYPATNTYAETITYKLVTAQGITTNLAEIVSVDGDKVTVRALGDGEFYLRALCDNGTSRHHIMSQIIMRAEGLGSATFNPYELVKGGLRTIEIGDINNGVEKGAEFGGHGVGIFGFEQVDFGKYGSDTISLPIFANTTRPVYIKIYDGIPNEGGQLIGDFKYHVPPVWMTYQALEYKLTKVLRGIHTLCFESEDGYDIEGFVFKAPVKEEMVIAATACEKIYGDKFTVGEDEITGIGNNVVLDYGDFDFTVKKPVAIRITGKSALPINSIHVSVTGDTTDRILCEFARADEYTTREFSLTGISGHCQISLIFLPGSDIDIKDIQFVTQ